MLVMFGTVVINVILDPFLINGWSVGPLAFPELGIQGRLSPLSSPGLAMLVGLYIMLSGTRGIQINLADMKPDLQYLRKILRIGVPASIEGTGRALSINAPADRRCSRHQSSPHSALGRACSPLSSSPRSPSRGVETMTGQNVGAGKYDRAQEANYVAAKGLFGVLGVVGVAIFFVPTPIVSVFTDDPAVSTSARSSCGTSRCRSGSSGSSGRSPAVSAVPAKH